MKNSQRFLLAATGFGLVMTSLSWGADEPFLLLARAKFYQQTSSSTVTFQNYAFVMNAEDLPVDAYNDVTVTLPTTGVFRTGKDSNGFTDGYRLEGDYTNLTNFNAAFPAGTGTYAISLSANSGGTLDVPLTIANLNFPSAVPTVSNYTAAQSIGTTATFLIQWNAFTDAATNDRIELRISSADDDYDFVATPNAPQPGALAGSTVSYSIPANSLPPGTDLSGQLVFARGDAKGSSSGIYYLSGAANATEFSLHTAGAVDTTPPKVNATNPVNHATGVASTASVTIGFSESMRKNGYSISYNGIGNVPNPAVTWISLTKLRISAPEGGWPKNTKIIYTLNPPTYPSSIEDLAGNALVKRTFSFTTGAL